MLADRGLDLAIGIKAGYNPETAVASWRVEIFARYAATREIWVSTEAASATGQTVTLAAAPDAVSAEDEELALSDVIGGRGACFLTLTAQDETGVPLWQCQGPVDFVAAGTELAPGAIIGKAIPLDLGAGTTIQLTILGNSAAGGSTIGDITGLEEALAGKADAADVTAALEGKQPLDATLTAFAALVVAANKLVYATGADAFALADFTAAARTLLAATTTAAQRSAIGLGSADAVEFANVRVDSAGLGSYTVPSLRSGPYQSGLSHIGDYGLALIANGTILAALDRRGGSNPVLDVQWPYMIAGRYRPIQSTVGTKPDANQFARCFEYFTDGANGQPCVAIAMGGKWYRLQLGAEISAT